jgi:hypothetical protein
MSTDLTSNKPRLTADDINEKIRELMELMKSSLHCKNYCGYYPFTSIKYETELYEDEYRFNNLKIKIDIKGVVTVYLNIYSTSRYSYCGGDKHTVVSAVISCNPRFLDSYSGEWYCSDMEGYEEKSYLYVVTNSGSKEPVQDPIDSVEFFELDTVVEHIKFNLCDLFYNT